MARPRKFDWDEAARMVAGGMSMAAVGRALGVSADAVREAVDPAVRERMAERHARWQRSGTCPVCGGPATRGAGGVQHRCRRCAARAAANETATEAKCVSCKRWKPLSEFSRRDSPGRVTRQECRECDTAAKRAWRERNRERERAYQREYKARRRGSP